MIRYIFLLMVCYSIGLVFAPPPRHHQPPAPPTTETPEQQQAMLNLSYERYLMEVVKILETDDKFQAKLKDLPEADVKAGKIADHVDELSSDIRSKLNEAKLKEVDRLSKAVEAMMKDDQAAADLDIMKHTNHLDHDDLRAFSKEDLRNLIQRTVTDLDEMDAKRKGEFKEYEMKKEAEQHHKLAQINDEAEREKAKREYEDLQAKHKKHDPVKHPGGKEHLEEVWEEKDHMDKDNFDPRTFFLLHDIDGNGLWDEQELEALFQIELDKVYNESNPGEDDPREREEEMERMREHVMKEMDKNKDRMVSLEEFMADTQTEEYKKDEDWKTIDAQPPAYNPEEMKQFEEEYAKAMGWEYPYPAQTTQMPHPNANQHPNAAHHQQPVEGQGHAAEITI